MTRVINSIAMTDNEHLIHAQMQLECMTEALAELWSKPKKARLPVLKAELVARLWAALYLTQAVRCPNVEKPDNFDEVLREANAHNGVMEDAPDVMGMH